MQSRGILFCASWVRLVIVYKMLYLSFGCANAYAMKHSLADMSYVPDHRRFGTAGPSSEGLIRETARRADSDSWRRGLSFSRRMSARKEPEMKNMFSDRYIKQKQSSNLYHKRSESSSKLNNTSSEVYDKVAGERISDNSTDYDYTANEADHEATGESPPDSNTDYDNTGIGADATTEYESQNQDDYYYYEYTEGMFGYYGKNHIKEGGCSYYELNLQEHCYFLTKEPVSGYRAGTACSRLFADSEFPEINTGILNYGSTYYIDWLNIMSRKPRYEYIHYVYVNIHSEDRYIREDYGYEYDFKWSFCGQNGCPCTALRIPHGTWHSRFCHTRHYALCRRSHHHPHDLVNATTEPTVEVVTEPISAAGRPCAVAVTSTLIMLSAVLAPRLVIR